MVFRMVGVEKYDMCRCMNGIEYLVDDLETNLVRDIVHVFFAKSIDCYVNIVVLSADIRRTIACLRNQ